MTAATTRRRLLLALALLGYAAVSGAFYEFEIPGRGIGHFYYLPIALVALTSGPYLGAAAGTLGAGLWMVVAMFTPSLPGLGVPVLPTLIRLIVFTAVGALIGTFAQRNRTLVEELSRLAERDQLTGLPNTRAFEGAITRRLELRKPFALLIGDTKQISDERSEVDGSDALRRLADRLASALKADDEVARLGATTFAVLTSAEDMDDASRLSARLERTVGDAAQITFGWSVYPQDGDNALSLYRAADERMYARKVIRDRPGAPPRDLWLAPAASDAS